MKTYKDSVSLFFKGMAMGIAEVIPGVSGGTIAFVTNIYERLLKSIKTVLGPEVLRAWRSGGAREAWNAIDGRFLTILLLGMGTGLITGVFGVTHLLEHYPRFVWAFFFGLIIASCLFVGRQVERWNFRVIFALIAGTVLALWYTLAVPGQGSEAWWFIFLSGLIAISALILPGVSGSFMLVLLGMYTLIIPSLKAVLQDQDVRSITIIAVFAAGCLVGLATFSRVLTWVFQHYRDLALAALTGFMLGSLNKIWPWREVLEYRMSSSGIPVPVIERSVWPWDFSGPAQVPGVVIVMLAGFLVVYVLEKVSIKEKHGN